MKGTLRSIEAQKVGKKKPTMRKENLSNLRMSKVEKAQKKAGGRGAGRARGCGAEIDRGGR